MRIRLTATSDPRTRVRPGDTGTVLHTDDLGTLHVRWDNGATFGLVPDVDEWVPLCSRCGEPVVPGCCVTEDGPWSNCVIDEDQR